MARYDMTGLNSQETAVEGGAPDALFQLGLMYCSGREVDLDLVQAHKWFSLSAVRGNSDARRYRAEIATEMTKTQVARAQRLAREWLAVH